MHLPIATPPCRSATPRGCAKIVNDIFLANVSGYWKFGGGDNQAVSASLRYFSLGEVSTYSEIGQTFNPYEMAFDIGYSRKLSESYSMGIVFRYISSLGYNSDGGSEAGDPVSGASAFRPIYRDI